MQIPNQLKISQKVELLEMVFDIECANRYEINYPNGQRFLLAYETCGFLWKWFLPKQRPCEIHLIDENKNEHFLLKRNFFFFFPSYDLFASGELIGKIKRNFAIFHTVYKLFDAQNNFIAKLEGPFWRPWTFNIQNHEGKKIGLIGKKLSGLKELISDADNFSFEIDDSVTEQDLRALVLASTFAVDYDNFDKPAQSKD